MRTTFVLALGLLLGGAGGEADKELKKLSGTWVLVAGEVDGKPVSAEHVKASKMTMKGGHVSLHTPHQSKEIIESDFTVDLTKTPRRMDWVRATEPGKGKKMHAIYEWLGEDSYRICFAPPGKDRPAAFKTKPGSGQILHVWKRAKD